MLWKTMFAGFIALVPLAAAAQSGDSAGRSLAATCANCHGTEGHSVAPEVVPLAGLSKEHIQSQMKAFKEGTRPSTVMQQLAKGYTDRQIESLAAYFAAQKR